MRHSHWHRLLADSAVVTLGIVVAAQQPAPEGSYTADQATRGEAVYDRHCTSCHLRDLSGSTGPGLAGPNFINAWGKRTASELFEVTKGTMPQGGEGSLTNDEYISIVAYILQAQRPLSRRRRAER